MNLNRIDLNLFSVFDAIYTAGSLTKAADVLCITQPAVSNSLSRLREMLNDPLFVRTGHSMTPTPVAQNIIGPAREALGLLRKSVQESQIFDPLRAEKTFHFSTRDLFEAGILPRLLAHLEAVAPKLSLSNYEVDFSEIVSSMASGNLDFYADSSSFSDPHLCKKKIAQDRFIVIARKNHPELKQGMTLETFTRLSHISVSQRRTGPSHIDAAINKLGLKRQIAMRGRNYLTPPSVVVRTNLIACLPYHLAKHYDVAIYEMPIKLPPLEYFLYWHVSADQDHGHIWMREQIYKVLKIFED